MRYTYSIFIGLAIWLFLIMSIKTEKKEATEYIIRKYNTTRQYNIEDKLRSVCNTEWDWPRSCDHMIATFYAESGMRTWAISPTNDYWICQIHKAHYHRWFFNVDDRRDLQHQINYCVGMRQNHFDRWIHPDWWKWWAWNAYR